MKIILVLAVCMSFFLGSRIDKDRDQGSVQQGFQDPPAKARPVVYYWWLGGYVDTLRLKEEMISMKNAGISGFTIFEIGSRDTVLVKAGPAFLGEESLSILKYAIDEAGKLGMEVGLNTSSSWNAGGSWIPPKHAAKSIFYAQTEVSGGKPLTMKLPFPDISKKDAWGKQRRIQFGADGKPVFYQEIAVLAIPAGMGKNALDTAQVINVSRFFDPKTEVLNWEAPAGRWDILRYVCSNSGENLVLPSKYSAGPTVDHYDAEAAEFHFTYVIDKLESVLGDLKKTALKSFYMASYEEKALTWTTTLPEMFRKVNGYGVEKFLPVLFTDDLFLPELSVHFKMDYQRTISELMINNFYKKSKEICNRHGLKNNCESGGPGLPLHKVPVEPIKALGALDIPRGEFWINHGRFNEKGIDIMRVVKEVSAASHLYGRGIVEMEAFTTFQHWQESPFDMKPVGDRAFCEGMNKVVVHGSTHNPAGTGYPGIVYHAGVHYNDKQVWWPKIKPFNDYLARISFVLQEAGFVADVLYYYGDTIPNYGGHKNSRFTAGPGYDYELINTEKLKELIVEGNELVLPQTGARFRLLVLAKESQIHPDVLIKLDELARQGAVIIGPKPENVLMHKVMPGMPDLKKMLDELWMSEPSAGLKTNQAKIDPGIGACAMLQKLNIAPDFGYEDHERTLLDFIHYSCKGMEFYLVRNTTGEWISRACRFRQQNKVPEIWDPVSGKISPVSVYDQTNGVTDLPLSLAPYESLFVVFRKGSPAPHDTRIVGRGPHPPVLRYTPEGVCVWEEGTFERSRQEQSAVIRNYPVVSTLEGPWEVSFPKGWGAPESVVFPKLTSWTESEDQGIRYFSGVARYEKMFVHVPGPSRNGDTRVYLDLGDLSGVGEVWLNDQLLGITWAKPYRFDVTGILKPGENRLTVEIANTWSNRIVGDAVTGEKYTRTNITNTNVKGLYRTYFPWSKVPLIESGLFGPVTITEVRPVK